jgi:hypothetical protein
MTTRDRCRRDRYRGARGWRNRHALVHALMTDLPQSTLEAMAKIRWDRDEQRTRIDPIPWDANEHQRKCAAGGAREQYLREAAEDLQAALDDGGVVLAG